MLALIAALAMVASGAAIVVSEGEVAQAAKEQAKKKTKKKKKGGGKLTQALTSKSLIWPNASTATASCAGGRHLAFGGFQTNTEFPYGSGVLAIVEAAGATSTKLWEVRARNDYAAEAGTLTSYAYCAAGKKPKLASTVTTLGADDGVAPPATAKIVATQCPEGTTVSGGGPRISGDNPNDNRHVIILGLERSPASSRVLQAYLINEELNPVTATMTATCRKGKAPGAVEQLATLAEPEQKSVTVTCSGKKTVRFGGFIGEVDPIGTDNAFIYSMFRPTAKTLTVSAGQTNFGPNFGNTGSFKAIAYCG